MTRKLGKKKVRLALALLLVPAALLTSKVTASASDAVGGPHRRRRTAW